MAHNRWRVMMVYDGSNVGASGKWAIKIRPDPIPSRSLVRRQFDNYITILTRLTWSVTSPWNNKHQPGITRVSRTAQAYNISEISYVLHSFAGEWHRKTLVPFGTWDRNTHIYLIYRHILDWSNLSCSLDTFFGELAMRVVLTTPSWLEPVATQQYVVRPPSANLTCLQKRVNLQIWKVSHAHRALCLSDELRLLFEVTSGSLKAL